MRDCVPPELSKLVAERCRQQPGAEGADSVVWDEVARQTREDSGSAGVILRFW